MAGDPEFEVRYVLDPVHVEQLVGLYAHAWWAATRRRPHVDRMLEATDVVVAIVERRSDQLVGFARALTDDV